MSAVREFTKGFWELNPLLKLVLGLCPALAVTTSVENGVGMGLAATFVLVCSNVMISMIRKIIPKKVRIPCFIVVIASFVTIVDLVMHGFFIELYRSLGLFIPLIVVNCIILGRAEAFASRNTVFRSLLDGLGMGFGFTVALIVLGTIREILGNGTVFGVLVMGTSYEKFLIMILPPGAFITLGLLLGLMNKIEMNRK